MPEPPLLDKQDKSTPPAAFCCCFGRNPKKFNLVLARAIIRGDVERTKNLVYDYGFDLTASSNSFFGRGQGGWTYLHFAADRGHVELIPFLVDHGADINAVNLKGRTALHKAARNGHGHVVTKLVMLGADLKMKDCNGLTAFQIAKNFNKEDVARILRAAESNFKEKFSDKIKKAAMQGNATMVEQLLREEGYNPNAVNEFNVNYTYMHYAASRGRVNVVRSLAKLGTQIVSNVEGDTPLHVAAYYGYADTCRALIKLGADPNEENQDGRAPIHWACHSGDQETVEVLVDAGANLLVADLTGNSPVSIARKRGFKELVAFLEKRIMTEYERIQTQQHDEPQGIPIPGAGGRDGGGRMSPKSPGSALSGQYASSMPQSVPMSLSTMAMAAGAGNGTNNEEDQEKRWREEWMKKQRTCNVASNIQQLKLRLSVAENDLKARLAAAGIPA